MMGPWLWILIFVLLGCATPPEPMVESAPEVRAKSVPAHSSMIDWPVDQARLTQRFHLSKHPHFGIDLAAPRGTKILSAHHGTVVYTGHDFRGYGKLVIIEQDSIWATFYSHLDRIQVKEGQIVEQGQVIGTMGKTGNARGGGIL